MILLDMLRLSGSSGGCGGQLLIAATPSSQVQPWSLPHGFGLLIENTPEGFYAPCFFIQEAHQPLAETSLPGKSWQRRQSPVSAWMNWQLAQV